MTSPLTAYPVPQNYSNFETWDIAQMIKHELDILEYAQRSTSWEDLQHHLSGHGLFRTAKGTYFNDKQIRMDEIDTLIVEQESCPS